MVNFFKRYSNEGVEGVEIVIVCGMFYGADSGNNNYYGQGYYYVDGFP